MPDVLGKQQLGKQVAFCLACNKIVLVISDVSLFFFPLFFSWYCCSWETASGCSFSEHRVRGLTGASPRGCCVPALGAAASWTRHTGNLVSTFFLVEVAPDVCSQTPSQVCITSRKCSISATSLLFCFTQENLLISGRFPNG